MPEIVFFYKSKVFSLNFVENCVDVQESFMKSYVLIDKKRALR